MKKTFIFAGVLGAALVYAQTQRVGINTSEPKATLDIAKGTGLPAGQVEGVLFPRLTQAERNNMDQTQFLPGLQIFNTDKNCIDIWTGSNWQCTDGTKKDNQGDTPASPSAVYSIRNQGFGGVFIDNIALTSDNRITFTLENIGAAAATNLDLSNAVTITNDGGGNVSVIPGQNSNVSIAAGRKVTLTYILTGTPKAGTIRAKMTYNGAQSEEAVATAVTEAAPEIPQYVTLGNGERSFVSVSDYDFLPYNGPTTATAQLTSEGVDGVSDYWYWGGGTTTPAGIFTGNGFQGKITTTGVEVYIPITVDPAIGSQTVTLPYFSGIEIPVSNTYTEDGNGRNIKLSWYSQPITINTTYITARISAVDNDLLIKMLDFNSGIGQDYEGILLGTFNYANTQGGTTQSSFKVKATPGIPGRDSNNFNDWSIYVPVKDPLTGKIWLNNNLGAVYTKPRIYNTATSSWESNPNFDPGQQATEHWDNKAFGSLFQFGRPHDGHELVTWSGYPPTYVNSTTTWLYGSYPPNGGSTVVPATVSYGGNKYNFTMWYGITTPAAFPITLNDSSNYAVCPKGFRIASPQELYTVISRTKPQDSMKDFYVRIPSVPFINRDQYSNQNAYYGQYRPKLWTNYYEAGNIDSDPRATGTIATVGTTDYGWNSATQKWVMLDELKTMPATLPTGLTPDAYDGEYFIYKGVVRDNLINDRWDRTALWTTDGTTDTYTIQNYGAPHSANNSFAIRCIKI
ncbi:MAG: hypothetical protein ACFNQA_02290 [Flavobacteriaceae bacterium]